MASAHPDGIARCMDECIEKARVSAFAVLFLASDRSAMITGVVLDVDGGQLLGIAADYQEDLARRMEFSAANLTGYLESRGMGG